MNKEIIKDWLNDIATPTGISYSGDQTLSESMVKEIIDYVDDLEQQVKKQKEVIDKIFSRITLWKMEDITKETAKILDELLDILKEVSE